MEIRDTSRIVGLLGYPVSHSLSPAMHNAGFQRLGIDARYVLMPAPPENLPAAVDALRDPKCLGANVTLPHKEGAFSLVDERSEISEMMGVVNTIVNRGGKLWGTTTDPAGFLNAFREAGHDFDGKSVALLGNGGSARAIAFALAVLAKARRVTIVARSSRKSATLLEEIRRHAPAAALASLTFAEYFEARKEHDVVVNATPIGMHPNVDASPLAKEALVPGQIVYDIVYNPEETLLLRHARESGCQTVGGLGMLVHQGLESFNLWLREFAPDKTGKLGPDVFYDGIRRQREARAAAEATA